MPKISLNSAKTGTRGLRLPGEIKEKAVRRNQAKTKKREFRAMKRKLSMILAAVMTAVMLAGCSAQETSSDGAPKPELNIIVAHNQTSMENPYT